MIHPPIWSDERLEIDRLSAIATFSKERLEEPLDEYLEAFDVYQGYVEEVLATTIDLSDLDQTGLDVLSNPRLLEAFRYLAGPPISENDLKVLADAHSLTKKNLETEPELVLRLIDIVRKVLDRRRFSWVVENRAPTEAERNAAVLASTALMAARHTQTKRRTTAKNQQEEQVKEALRQLGFTEVQTRKIPTVSAAPSPGEFCGECLLGTRKGDIIVRLWDQRVMPIECKVSNSSINSVKRLNNDAAVKADTWKKDFGIRQVVPSSVLSGVYKLHNLSDAQERGLTIFWAHNLKPLTDWIEQTTPLPP